MCCSLWSSVNQGVGGPGKKSQMGMYLVYCSMLCCVWESWFTIFHLFRFHNRWNLPHCLGAIDGRHMVIKAPQASGSKFFNYKKTTSIVLMAVADSDYSFIAVDVGAEGSHNDAAILNNSELWTRVRNNQMHIPPAEQLPNSNNEMPYFFVGDGIFQLQRHLMKPFALRRLTVEEAIFNYRITLKLKKNRKIRVKTFTHYFGL